MFVFTLSPAKDKLAVPSSNPIKIPSLSKPCVVWPIEINGFSLSLLASAFNAITGVAPSAPMFIVFSANTSVANNISVATDENVAPNESQ